MPNGLSKSFHWDRFLPHRLSSQLLMFVGVIVAFAAVLAGSLFIYASAKQTRNVVSEQILFLAKSIASVSGNFIITKDLSSVEEVLIRNADFPFVESILMVDAVGRPLGEVIKKEGVITPHFGLQATQPIFASAPIDVATGLVVDNNWWSILTPSQSSLEIWNPIKAGSLLGAIRIRYSLASLQSDTWMQLRRALAFAVIAGLFVLLLMSLLLRAPMRALSETTEFAKGLNKSLGRQITIYGSTIEISELSHALNMLSQQLLYQERALAERIEQNQSILDNMVDGVITVDAIGTIRSFNVAASTIFGYRLEDVLGRNFKKLMPDSHVMEHDAFMGNHDLTVDATIAGGSRELEGRRKNGEIFPMDLGISRSVDHDEIIYIGIVRDVTERRRLERLKSEFVATVSHELRTPLTSIHGALKLIEGGITGVIPAPALKMVSLAQKNSQRLIVLINDLLDMEKLIAGKMALVLDNIDLVEILQQAMLENQVYGSTLNVKFVFNPPSQNIKVTADAGRVAQVLANILSNAVKFSSGATQVDIRVSSTDTLARVEIEDHGKGIPLDFQSEIFSAFAQANNGNTRNQGGTGLGLKISKGLIDAMHGEIGFDTVEELGTTFWFTLPLAKEDSLTNTKA